MNQTLAVRSSHLRFLIAVAALLALSLRRTGEAGAGEPASLRHEPDPAITALAELEEPMALDALIRTALVASGTPESARPLYAERIWTLADAAPPATGDVAADGETLLRWMHEETLVRYVENQTRLDTLMDNGRYNCVSSAVLYLIIARNRGIPVHGVVTTDHSFCRIPTDTDPSGGIDVETTTPWGFDPGTRKDAVDAFSGRTGFVYAPPGNYRLRRDIGEKELISLIYQNRLAALQRSGRWVEAVGLARDRWELAGSEAAGDDYRTSLTNYAAEMNRTDRRLEGLSFLNAAAAEFDGDAALVESAKALLGNEITYALRAGDIERARDVLGNEDLLAMVPEDFRDERLRDVEVRSLENRIKTESFAESISAIDDAVSDGVISRDRWGEFAMHLWSTEARRVSRGGRWLDGWRFLLNAPDEVKSLRAWDPLEDSYAHNAVVVYHNSFAEAVQRRRYGEAESILDEALAMFPDHPTLRQDRRVLEQRTDNGR